MTRTDLNRWIGGLFILFPIVVIVSVILQVAAVSDGPDPSRDKIAESLADIHDNEGLFLVGMALDVVTNVLSVMIAAVIYLLLRGRNRPLALLGFAGMLTGSALFMLADVSAFTVTRLAADLADGTAGEAEILEIARAVVFAGNFGAMSGATLLGLGLLAFAGLLVWAPQSGGATEAASTFPRWIGWLAGLSAVLVWLIWLATIDQALWFVAMIGFLGGLVTLLALGWWLLKAAPEPAAVE